LVQLAQWRDRFAELGVQVAGMTYDDRALLAQFHEAQQLGFPLLQDENTKHVDAYGVKNMEYEPGDQGYGIPHPGILYIQRDGTVALKFAVPGYRERPPLAEVHAAIRAALANADAVSAVSAGTN
jgi:peroxiredoxin